MVVWLCHARVGHRQGLYPEQPSPETVGVFLCLALLLRSKIATRNRSPPGALSKKASPPGEAFVFITFENGGCCDQRAQTAACQRLGLYPQTLVAHATGVCSFWRSELLRRRCVRCRMRWNCRGVDRRRCSAITYDGQHAAIQSVLEGARSCLSTSKHVAVLVGIGPPCWWSRCAWHVLSDWR